LLLCSDLQFAESTKPHLGIVERNSPTPVRRRFSLTQEGLGKVIVGGEGLAKGKRVEARGIFLPVCIPLVICSESCSGIGLI